MPQFLVRAAGQEIKALFYFVIDAERCLRTTDSDKEAKQVPIPFSL